MIQAPSPIPSVEEPWALPSHINIVPYLTYHCRAFLEHVAASDKVQKRVAVKMLRRIANVLDDAEPEPAPLTAPAYEEFVRLSVPPEDMPFSTRLSQIHSPHPTNRLYAIQSLDGQQQRTQNGHALCKRSWDGELEGASLRRLADSKRVKLSNDERPSMDSARVLPASQPSLSAQETEPLTRPTTPRPHSASPAVPAKDAAVVLLSLTNDDSLFVPESDPPRNVQQEHPTPSPDATSAVALAVPHETISNICDEVDRETLAPEPPTAALIAKSRRAPRSTQLEDVTYSLSAEINQARITQLRDEFFKKLKDKKVVVQVSQQPQGCGFTEAEAIDITNLLFTDLIGWPALKRLRSLLTEYRRSEEEEIGLRGIARAEHLAKLSSTPLRFREYFASVSRATRFALNDHTANKPPFQFNNIQGIIESVETHRRYGEIMQAAEEGDPSITAFLCEQGYKKRQRGPTIKSAAKDFIRQTLSLSKTALDLQLQQAETVAHMVELFGTGIIPIFPIHALWKLRKWGLQRMNAALALFKQVFPYLEGISETLNRYVYIPITEGLEIPLKYAKLSGNTPLFDLIQNAVLVKARKQCGSHTAQNSLCSHETVFIQE